MSTIVPNDSHPVVRFMPMCEHCGGPVREQRCDPVDITEPWDRMRTQVPGPTYNVPCGCVLRPGHRASPEWRRAWLNQRAPVDHEVVEDDRTSSGEHTSADTDDVVANINAAMEDWELEAAHWSPDGSHEHDPPFWTRMDHGNSAMSGQAFWGCDDVADRMRPGSTACFPWQGARR